MHRKTPIKPTLKWYIVKSVPTKNCILYPHEKFEILTYPNQDKLSNKRSELVSKYRHVNKYLLSNYKIMIDIPFNNTNNRIITQYNY